MEIQADRASLNPRLTPVPPSVSIVRCTITATPRGSRAEATTWPGNARSAEVAGLSAADHSRDTLVLWRPQPRFLITASRIPMHKQAQAAPQARSDRVRPPDEPRGPETGQRGSGGPRCGYSASAQEPTDPVITESRLQRRGACRRQVPRRRHPGQAASPAITVAASARMAPVRSIPPRPERPRRPPHFRKPRRAPATAATGGTTGRDSFAGPKRAVVEVRRQTQMRLAARCSWGRRLSRFSAGLHGTDLPKRRFRPTSG
jgi:hypothetical protein